MRSFEGTGVIVTGARAGIGRATAQRFASEGADVMLIGRRHLSLDDAPSDATTIELVSE